MKVYIDCVGCEQREMDAQHVIDYLSANNLSRVRNPNECDYAILITCAVDRANEKKSRKRLDKLVREMKDGSKLVIGGCLPSIHPDISQNYQVYATFSPRTIDSLDKIFQGDVTCHINKISCPNNTEFDEPPCSNSKSSRDEYELAKNRFKIKVNEGCLSNCSYCAIKSATGRLKSVGLESILNQVSLAIKHNEPSIMLVGGDTGAYGIDIGLRFYDLLKTLLDFKGIPPVYIHDFNVNWLIRDLPEYLEVFKRSEEENIIRIANIPIQSGSDRILQLMRRHYTKSETIDAISGLMESSPSLALGTHLIVGFPSETDKDFQQTIDLLHQTNLDFVSCFPYSENKSTDSARLSGKVDEEVIKSRILLLKKYLEIKFLQ